VHDVPPDADLEWIRAFRAKAIDTGALHTYGGTDYFVWRPGGDPTKAAIGGRIPPFTYGRGKADNWIVDMAIENGVAVIDASAAVVAVHPAHGYAIKPQVQSRSVILAYRMYTETEPLECQNSEHPL
jgi:hypothetical protein